VSVAMIVNGENMALSTLGATDTLFDLISYLKLSPNRVAVELNGNLIDRTDYPSVRLVETDLIELIHYVGGG
jgi:thiamine biosynthesis protein ThiS